MSGGRTHVWIQRFKGRSNLMLQWIDPETGQRKSKSAKTDDLELAEQKRGDHEADLNNGRYQEPSRLDWERFRELFQEEYLPGLRPRSREKYETVLDVFEEIIKPAKLRNITERTLSQFVKGMRERRRPVAKAKANKQPPRIGLAPWTIKNYLVTLRTALDWAVQQKLLPTLPTFPTIKVPKKKPQPIPAELFEKLLEKAPDKIWKAYLLCGWWGGLRLSEAQHLCWERSEERPWLDLERNRITLPAVFAKSGQDQFVPLHPVLRQALAEQPRTGPMVFPFKSRKGGGPLTRGAISHRVLTMAKLAGVKLSMHRLRKSFGCRCCKSIRQGWSGDAPRADAASVDANHDGFLRCRGRRLAGRHHSGHVTLHVTPARPTKKDLRRDRRKSFCNGEDGIRTRGGVLPPHRFSKPALSATQPPLRIGRDVALAKHFIFTPAYARILNDWGRDKASAPVGQRPKRHAPRIRAN